MEVEFNHLNHATRECKYQCARSKLARSSR
jgi:hypothetical protein